MLLQGCGIIWNVLQMFATKQQKVITKCVHHNMLFKDTMHCAHIPLNVVSKGAQPLAQLECPGRGRDSLAKRHREGGGGVRRKQPSS